MLVKVHVTCDKLKSSEVRWCVVIDVMKGRAKVTLVM